MFTVGGLLEIRITLPLDDEEEILVLGRVVNTCAISENQQEALVEYLMIAPDHKDVLIRYLMRRQRLEQVMTRPA
jgi:hypothetical protein